MKKLLGAAALALVLNAPGYADSPYYGGRIKAASPEMDAIVNWSGPEIGLIGGWHDGFESTSIGALAGYNWQFQRLVFGVEGDFLYLFGKEDSFLEQETEKGMATNWYGSLRGKIGYTVGPVLPYATFGWGWAGTDAFEFDGPNKHIVSFSPSGFVWGLGAEARLFDKVNVRLEFRRYEFGEQSIEVNRSTITRDLTDNVVMGGITYKF